MDRKFFYIRLTLRASLRSSDKRSLVALRDAIVTYIEIKILVSHNQNMICNILYHLRLLD